MYLHKRKAKGEHEDVFKYFLLREVKIKGRGLIPRSSVQIHLTENGFYPVI